MRPIEQIHMPTVTGRVGMAARHHLSVGIFIRLTWEDAGDIPGVLGARAGGQTTRPTVTAVAKMIAGDADIIRSGVG